MLYQSFLHLQSKLSMQESASLEIEGVKIFFYNCDQTEWMLSLVVEHPCPDLASDLDRFLCGRSQTGFSYCRDTHQATIRLKIAPLETFVQFRKAVASLLEIHQNYCDLLLPESGVTGSCTCL